MSVYNRILFFANYFQNGNNHSWAQMGNHGNLWVDFSACIIYQQHGARQSTAESPILPSSGRVAPYFSKEGEEEGITQ